jgi:hypothetical protein
MINSNVIVNSLDIVRVEVTRNASTIGSVKNRRVRLYFAQVLVPELGTLESANKDEMPLISCHIPPIEYRYFLNINISTLKRTEKMEKL